MQVCQAPNIRPTVYAFIGSMLKGPVYNTYIFRKQLQTGSCIGFSFSRMIYCKKKKGKKKKGLNTYSCLRRILMTEGLQ